MSHPLCVLVVDDHPDTADSLALFLGSAGFDVRAAVNPADALGSLNGWQPDVALLDLGLPGQSGFDLARLLCEQSERRPLLVAVTGHQGERGRALAAGFDHFFLKPVPPRELVDLLEGLAARGFVA